LKRDLGKEENCQKICLESFHHTTSEAMVAEMFASDYRRYYNRDILEVEPE